MNTLTFLMLFFVSTYSFCAAPGMQTISIRSPRVSPRFMVTLKDGEGYLTAVKKQLDDAGIYDYAGGQKTSEVPILGDLWIDKLVQAVRDEDEKLVAEYAQYVKNINLPDHRGETAITAAAFQGNVAIFRCLLRHRANVNNKQGDGRTPLMIAQTTPHQNPALRQLILDRQSLDLTAMDEIGATAADHAAHATHHRNKTGVDRIRRATLQRQEEADAQGHSMVAAAIGRERDKLKLSPYYESGGE